METLMNELGRKKLRIVNSPRSNFKFFLYDIETGELIKKAQKERTLVNYCKNNFTAFELYIDEIPVDHQYAEDSRLFRATEKNPFPKEPIKRITNYESLFEQFN